MWRKRLAKVVLCFRKTEFTSRIKKTRGKRDGQDRLDVITSLGATALRGMAKGQ